MTAIALFVAMAAPVRLVAQSNYSVVELGERGGTAGSANGINDRGWISGTDNLAGDLTTVATLWLNGKAIPLGTLNGGPNSAVAWPVKNNNGVIVGISELPDLDPEGEFFSCWPFLGEGNPSGRICQGFRWQNNHMTALPPFPGGHSSYATQVNNQGQIVGWAENGVHDPTCDPDFQILQFRAAIWQPDGTMDELPPLPGDSTSAHTNARNRNGAFPSGGGFPLDRPTIWPFSLMPKASLRKSLQAFVPHTPGSVPRSFMPSAGVQMNA